MIEITKYNVTNDNSDIVGISGDNQKGIAVVFPLSITSSEMELLDTIISKALSANPDKDVLKVAIKSGRKLNWLQVSNNHTFTNVLCFGVNPRSLSLNFDFRYNEVIRFNNLEFIFSNNLFEIAEDQQLKKALWSCIKSCVLI